MRRLVRGAPSSKLAQQLGWQTLRLRQIRRLPRRQGAAMSADQRAGALRQVRKEAADKAWKNAGRVLLEAELAALNRGSDLCCYCNWNEWNTVDHFYPRARDPLQAFHWKNLFPACSQCQATKVDRFPLGLLNPAATSYQIEDHLYMHPQTGIFTPKTPAATGAETVYKWNIGNRPKRRAVAFLDYCELLRRYSAAKGAGDAAERQRVWDRVQLMPFAAVLALMIAWVGQPEEASLPPEVAQIIRANPEIRSWV